MNTVSTSKLVRRNIEKLEPGEVFGYSNFNVPKEEELSLAKSLSRLAKSGVIVRVSKGKYYKPRTSVFGNIKPTENQIVTALTERKNKRVGYLTGISIYNRLGLTTQLSNLIVIATTNPQASKEVSGYRIKFVKRDFEINENEIQLLQLLDAIKDIKKIPDASADEALKVLTAKFKTLPVTQLKKISKLALNYNAATRALVGALLESKTNGISVTTLYRSLNPLSKYPLKISNNILPNRSKWNIE